MATKVVNGVRSEMTNEEVVELEASRPPIAKTPREPSDIEVIREALTGKKVITQTDLNAARLRLKS